MFGEPSAARVTSLASFFFQRPAERKNGWTLRQFPAVRSAWFYVFFLRRKKKYARRNRATLTFRERCLLVVGGSFLGSR